MADKTSTQVILKGKGYKNVQALQGMYLTKAGKKINIPDAVAFILENISIGKLYPLIKK